MSTKGYNHMRSFSRGDFNSISPNISVVTENASSLAINHVLVAFVKYPCCTKFSDTIPHI